MKAVCQRNKELTQQLHRWLINRILSQLYTTIMIRASILKLSTRYAGARTMTAQAFSTQQGFVSSTIGKAFSSSKQGKDSHPEKDNRPHVDEFIGSFYKSVSKPSATESLKNDTKAQG